MRRLAVPFSIVLGFGAVILAPTAGARETIKIKACQTISQPGSYELVNNLAVIGFHDCLVITTSDVTIDLAGFLISGSGPAGGVAIRGGGGIAVRNGSITGFGGGVALGNDSIVEGLRVVGGCGPACASGIVANGIVKGNIAVSFREIAIQATGVITGNQASGAIRGFLIGRGSTVIGNTAVGNAFGFSVECPANVTDNTAIDDQQGLALFGEGCNNTNNVAP